MTKAQLFTRLTRPLNTKAPAAMSAENQQFLVDAANLGLNQFTQTLPAMRLQEPRSERLVAPGMQTVAVVTGSESLTFSPTWGQVGNFLGCSVVVGGDSAAYNRLQSATSLLNTYEGGSGTTSLEVLCDALLFNQSFEIAGDVILQDGGDTWPLTWGPPNSRYPGGYRNAFGVVSGTALAAQRTIIRARPTNWWVEAFNGITGADSPSFLLRLWPQPEKIYHINFDLRLWPTALTVADLASEDVLPIQVNEEATFLNLCFPGLFPCTLWQGTANKDDYETAAAKARAMLQSNEQNRGHQMPGQVLTKPGY